MAAGLLSSAPALLGSAADALAQPTPATPIQHLVVIMDDGASFDHYFGTYPSAANTDGTMFAAAAGTPSVNGLTTSLLNSNPNEFNPQRLSHSQALTCDQNHGYAPEQKAFDGGAMDQFEQNTGADTCTGQPILFGAPGLVMDYYDGNTVTALWNYAQHFSMSDDNFQTTFGPESPAAINLVSGDTADAEGVNSTSLSEVSDPAAIGSANGDGVGTLYADADPAYDDCSDSGHTTTTNLVKLSGPNIGTMLDGAGVSWGWFQGGFTPTGTNGGYAVCGASHQNIGGNSVADYVPSDNPFQYYQSTSNPTHAAPSSEAAIGTTDAANHQYDLTDFSETLTGGNLPAVSFVMPPAYQNGHPGSSDPLDAQTFLVNTINAIESSSAWPSTAIVVTDLTSDGWYDHQLSPIVNASNDSSLDAAVCDTGLITLGGGSDRCGHGPRIPLVVISPYAPANSISHGQTDQSSILRFIEDNWLDGASAGSASFDNLAGSLDGPGAVLNFSDPPHFDSLQLNPTTGAVVSDTASYTVPGQPLGAAAAPSGDGQAKVSFTAPASDGGLAISGYTVTATDTTNPARGGQTAGASGSPITVAGLTDGDSYTFTVTAANAAGTGPASSASPPVTVGTVPGRPLAVSGTVSGDGQIRVSFSAPASDGGLAITGYTVTAADAGGAAHGGQTATGAVSPITVGGLTDGDSYKFTVTANNAIGAGPSSDASAAVQLGSSPAQPPGVHALTAGDHQARVSFGIPDDGGLPIRQYTVIASDTTNPTRGGQRATATGSPATLSGLTDGDRYTFTVSAANAVGDGNPSAGSNAVIPEPPVTLSFRGAKLGGYTRAPVTAGKITLDPFRGALASAVGRVLIAGHHGGSAAVNLALVRTHGIYVGKLSLVDREEHLKLVAAIHTAKLMRTGAAGDQLRGTASGRYRGRKFVVRFTL